MWMQPTVKHKPAQVDCVKQAARAAARALPELRLSCIASCKAVLEASVKNLQYSAVPCRPAEHMVYLHTHCLGRRAQTIIGSTILARRIVVIGRGTLRMG